MSDNWYFALEQRRDSSWQPCHEVTLERFTKQVYRATFAWVSRRNPVIRLFHGDLFEMHKAWPPDAENSVYFQHVANLPKGSLEELRIHWISAADLAISEWTDLTFLVEATVSAQFAHLFGDGAGRFPHAALRSAGMDSSEVSYLATGSKIREEPINQQVGKAAHQRRSVAPDYEVSVTWSASLTEMLGTESAAAFQDLKNIAPPEELRVILYFA